MNKVTPQTIKDQQDLYRACHSNDLSRLSSLVFQIKSADEVSNLLRHVGNECSIEVAQYLFKYAEKFNIDLTQSIEKEKFIYGFEFFVSWERLDIVELYVNFGFSVNNKNYNALAQAAKFGYLEIVRYFVENDADIYCNEHLALINAIHEKKHDIIFYFYTLYEDKSLVKQIIYDASLDDAEHIISCLNKNKLYVELDNNLESLIIKTKDKIKL